MDQSGSTPSVPAIATSTRTCSFWLEGEVVRTRFHPAADVSADDARENLAATAAVTGGRRARVLVDMRPVRSQSAEARAILAGPGATRVSFAVALLVSSPASRVLGNFFLRFNRPETPTRLFSSAAEARTWLLSVPPPGEAHGGARGGA
jgi:hypothetical protein